MFKQMKLNAKIISLAAMLILLTCLVAYVGYRSYSSVVNSVETSDAATGLVKSLQEMRQQEKDFIITKDGAYADAVEQYTAAIKDEAEQVRKELSRRDREKMDTFIHQVDEYEAAFKNYEAFEVQKNENLAQMRTRAKDALSDIDDIRNDLLNQLDLTLAETSSPINEKLTNSEDANQIVKWFLEARSNEKEFINTKAAEAREAVTRSMDRILELGTDLTDRFVSETNIRKLDSALSSVRAYRESFAAFAALMDEQDQAEGTMLSSVQSAETVCNNIQTDQKEGMAGQITGAKILLLVGTLLSIAAGVILAYLIILSISRGIFPVIQGLTEATDQVAGGSTEVATSSQALASGASEQAAGIEEISSSMEEMSSMTKQSAENAAQADNYMQESKKVVSTANESMNQLTHSINEISQASRETSNIIKTIDEIAFQTNLLALNAAVEAARAGEAGAGFAVVADEVRNLAMRAAEAAKDTATLIESIVKQIRESTGLVDTTSQAFGAVTQSSDKVAALVAEIAASAGELSRGIDQVNDSISGVDQIVQQNAASAEESASASEEMSAQSEQMKEYVRSLVEIVGSSNETGMLDLFSGTRDLEEENEYPFEPPAGEEEAPSPEPAPEPARAPKKKKPREVRPSEVIPMDDDDFQDF